MPGLPLVSLPNVLPTTSGLLSGAMATPGPLLHLYPGLRHLDAQQMGMLVASSAASLGGMPGLGTMLPNSGMAAVSILAQLRLQAATSIMSTGAPSKLG
jgi:hypothetical protein